MASCRLTPVIPRPRNAPVPVAPVPVWHVTGATGTPLSLTGNGGGPAPVGCPRREEVKGGTRRRMDMALRWVRLERPLGWVWTRRVRIPGARTLGSSSLVARRLGGLAGCQLTGPVSGRGPGSELAPQRAVAPRSRAGGAMPRRAETNPRFLEGEVPVKQVITQEPFLARGCGLRFRGVVFPLLMAFTTDY